MSEVSELQDLLLSFYNESRRAHHERYLNDPEWMARRHSYSWWSPEDDEYPEPITNWDELGWNEIVDEISPVEVDGYKFQSIEVVGGEGQGDHRHWVFTITDPEGNVTYWKIDGCYVSHYGTYWDDDPYKVTSRQKVVTVYE